MLQLDYSDYFEPLESATLSFSPEITKVGTVTKLAPATDEIPAVLEVAAAKLNTQVTVLLFCAAMYEQPPPIE
jgi:hypothetical protein